MADYAFFQHYIAFLTSPAGFSALLFVIPLLLYVYADLWRPSTRLGAASIPGCVRHVRRAKSNLDDQYDTLFPQDEACVKAIYVYPVKSCRGVELSASEVTGTGLKYDRLFSFAQLVSSKKQTPTNSESITETDTEITHQWRFITQREVPRLSLLSTELWIPDPRQVGDEREPKANRTPREQASPDRVEEWSANGGCLVIRFPYEQTGSIFGSTTETITIKIPLQPTPERANATGYTYESMTIWKDCPQSINLSKEIEQESLAKLKYFLGVSNPLGLFRVDDDNLRDVARGLPKDRLDEKFKVGFADAFPVSLLNISSVRAVDNSLPSDAKAKGKLDAIRFRANVYVSGPSAHTEDEWMRISVGECPGPHGTMKNANYHVACRTARCTLPNVHPETGIKDRNEPHSTLKRTRQVDEGAKPHPCLGLSMIPLFQQGIIRCGDKIEVLERGEHVYEKMFK